MDNGSSPPLLPDRHPQADLFICDVGDAVLKDLIPQLEHPFYSLSKNPDLRLRRYEHNGNWIEITPSIKGLATIYDKDLLIYCVSQLMDKKARGARLSKRVRINSHELLIFSNRGTSGRDYMALQDALDRIRGTVIKTNISTGGEQQTDTFGLIESSSVRRKDGLNGRLLWCEITLSDWVYNAVLANEVLALSREYFRLRRPVERRIYELARKHCGRQPEWAIAAGLLHKKAGSRSSLREFRRPLRNLAAHDHLPDYHVEYDEDRDLVTFRNRKRWWNSSARDAAPPRLRTDTYERARRVAPRYDVYWLEQEWRDWWAESGRPALDNADAAFVAFCRARKKRVPDP